MLLLSAKENQLARMQGLRPFWRADDDFTFQTVDDHLSLNTAIAGLMHVGARFDNQTCQLDTATLDDSLGFFYLKIISPGFEVNNFQR